MSKEQSEVNTTRISDEEYLRRYEDEVREEVHYFREEVRYRRTQDGHQIRTGCLVDLKDDDLCESLRQYVRRLARYGLWSGAFKAMQKDGTWREWSPEEMGRS